MFQLPNVISLLAGYQNGQQQGQQGQDQPQQPPAAYNPQPAKFHNDIYSKIVANNGNAPTQDVLNHLNVYGSPAYLMNHHQDQAVNNRRGDINQLYKDVLGREGEAEGLNNWLHSGQSADELVDDFALSSEFLGKNNLRSFDNQAYLNANPDVAADSYYGQNPEAHYNQHGATEGRTPYFTFTQPDRERAIALANQLRGNANQNKQISQNTDYIGQIQGLQKEIEALKSQNSYSGDSNSGWYTG